MKDFRQNVIAGFSVFLLALPLCLGIALASNFPPVAGILTAIVGGLIASWFGGAQLSIKGPAAGLIAIVLAAVQDLGGGDLQLGYERTLAVGVVVSIIQIIIGVSRKAIIAEVMPPAVIHGMLAAIGVIIVAKQSYVLMGIPADGKGPLHLLMQLPLVIRHANPAIFGIGLMSLFIAIVWPLIKQIKFIPSSIVILCVVIPISLYFDLANPHSYTLLDHTYSLGPNFLIKVPTHLLNAMTFPDFSIIFSPLSLKYIFTLALVGSIESLLTVCAVDTMTSQDKSSDLNHDLSALGIGNLVSSLIGGLPMISEIVRSKANIDYGATSFLSNFFHGLFMLLAVIFIPGVINTIPLSALAALLVFIGWRLASPKEFIHMYQVGKDQFALFLATLFTTLMTDLLIGVIVGVMLKIILLLVRGNGLMQLFRPNITIKKIKDVTYLAIEGPFTFAGYLKFKTALMKARKESKHIVIDLDAVTYLDHTVLMKLKRLEKEFTDIKLVIEENQQLVQLYNHPLSSRQKEQKIETSKT